jgi:hypothetical protein
MDQRIFEMDQRLQKLDLALEQIRMETRAANEAAARLRALRLELKQLLSDDLKVIVSDAVGAYIREEVR